MEEPKIIQISVGGENGGQVYGLGEDNKVYRYWKEEEKWIKA